MVQNDNRDTVGWMHLSGETQLRPPSWSAKVVRTVAPVSFGKTKAVPNHPGEDELDTDVFADEAQPSDVQNAFSEQGAQESDESSTDSGNTDVDEPAKTDEQLLADAYQSGVNDGRAQAQEQLRLELEKDFEEKALLMTRRLGDLLGQIRRESIDVVVELAAAMTSRIIHRDLDEDWIMGNIQSCLDRRIPNGPMRLRINPKIKERILALEPAPSWMEEMTADGPAIKLTSDPNMEPGDCILESEKMRIDARLDVQVESVRQVVQSLMAQELFVESS